MTMLTMLTGTEVLRRISTQRGCRAREADFKTLLTLVWRA